MNEIEIGRNKRGRRGFRFDDVAVVPSRRTRDPEDVSTAWQVDAYHFDIPVFAAPMDSLMSPETAIALGGHGGLGVDAGVDLFFLRGTTVSAEHVSGNREPLNLKRFIYELDVPVIVGGCATYTAALHLMRTGAAGVLVGFGGGASQTTHQTLGISVPLATAVSDVAAARRDYMDESGGRYVHVIADGGLGRSGDLVKAIACGADGLMVGAALARADEAPGRGYHWGSEAHHQTLPRGHRVNVGTVGSLEQILFGPGIAADGTTNLIGALRHAMATTGYTELKEFQRVEVVTTV